MFIAPILPWLVVPLKKKNKQLSVNQPLGDFMLQLASNFLILCRSTSNLAVRSRISSRARRSLIAIAPCTHHKAERLTLKKTNGFTSTLEGPGIILSCIYCYCMMHCKWCKYRILNTCQTSICLWCSTFPNVLFKLSSSSWSYGCF